jgi:hypothetical protein
MSDSISAVEIEEYQEDDDEMHHDDFGFIIGPDGSLKSVMYPEHLMEDPPQEIQAILSVFGINSFEELGNKTLH